MGSKLSNGFVRKKGKTWMAVLSWQEDGRQRRISKSTGIRCYPDKCDADGRVVKQDNRGRGAAEEYLRKWREELVAQEAPEPEVSRCNVALYDYAKEYFDLLHVKESTRSGYRAALSHLIGTDCGNTKLCELTAYDIYAWERSMYEDGLKENTVAHYHAFVAQVLKHAVGEGDIPRSPAARMRAPKRRPKPVNALTQEGVSQILQRVGTMGTEPLAVAVQLALAAGMRRAEICALRWLDVDLKGRVIHITHALTKGHGFSMDTPKDPAGGDATRDVEIGQGLASVLSERRAAMHAEIEALGDEWDDALFVLGSPDGTFKNPETLGREWSMLVRYEGWKGTQGLPVRFHDLRHAFATLAISKGMDVMVLAKVLGHRDATTTLNVYATALADAKRTEMERMDSFVYGIPDDMTPKGRHFRAST